MSIFSFELNFKNIFIIILILLIIIYISHSFIQEKFYPYNGTIIMDNLKKPSYKLENKKVAICFSGQIRDGYEECFLLYKLFIIDALNADVFCCFEDCNDDIKNCVDKILKPIKIKYVNNYVKDENNSINIGTLSMFNKIYIANELKKDYEKENNFIYDYVIRTRQDLIIKEYLPEFIFNDLNKLYLPLITPENQWWGYPDFMAISNSNLMNIYSDMFIYYTKDNDNKCNIAESLVYNYLKLNNIDCEMIRYPIQIYRFKYDNFSNFVDYIKYTLSLTERYIINNNC